MGGEAGGNIPAFQYSRIPAFLRAGLSRAESRGCPRDRRRPPFDAGNAFDMVGRCAKQSQFSAFFGLGMRVGLKDNANFGPLARQTRPILAAGRQAIVSRIGSSGSKGPGHGA